jgi:hypothetical protein
MLYEFGPELGGFMRAKGPGVFPEDFAGPAPHGFGPSSLSKE